MLKALVLCGGKGTRLRPLTYAIPKQLLPVANKPVIFFILEQIREAGIREIGLVVSPEQREQIRAVVSSLDWGVGFTYIEQDYAGGLAHAVACARDFLEESPFLMFLGDNLYQSGVQSFVGDFIASGCAASLKLAAVKNPRQCGVAIRDNNNRIVRVVEKPKDPPSNLAIAGIYLFGPVIHEAISQIKPSWRGELEITDAIQKLIEMGYGVAGDLLEGWWVDTGTWEGMLNANRLALGQKSAGDVRGLIDEASKVTGIVELGEGSVLQNCIVRGPVALGKNVQAQDSYIGPYASIGDNCSIARAGVAFSILLEGCALDGEVFLSDSIIGAGCKVGKKKTFNPALQLLLADSSEIQL